MKPITIKDRVDQAINKYFAKKLEGHALVSVLCDELNKELDASEKMTSHRFLHLAREVGWRPAMIGGHAVVCKKQPPVLDDEIMQLLATGREKLNAMQAEKVEKESRLHAMRTLQAVNDAEKILSLVPVELHEYVSHDHMYIYINLPGAAQLAAEYRVTTESREHEGLSDLFIAEIWLKEHSVSGKVWSLWQYNAYDGEISFYPCGDQEYYKDLDVALAMAIELGDGFAEAEKEAARQRAKFDGLYAPDDSIEETPMSMPLCPLLNKPCLGNDCAWFIAFISVDSCALKVMAEAA